MDALGRIKEAIANGIQSSEDDWVEVFNQYNLSGSSDAETIQNVQKFVSENFSFASRTLRRHMCTLAAMEK